MSKINTSTSSAVYELGLCGSAVEWSPFDSNILAVSASSNFGLVGSGAQLILSYKDGVIREIARLESKDSVIDCAWSESNRHQIAIAHGDGTLRIWDYANNDVLQTYNEHKQDIHAVDWNLVTGEHILTGAWDGSIKLWHPESSRSQRTFEGHTSGVNCVAWHARYADMFASTCDTTCKLWDMNDSKHVLSIPAHQSQILVAEWSKYDDNQLFTGSVDKLIRMWDIRQAKTPVQTLAGHEFAVRRIKASPHDPKVLASSSHDMTCALWNLDKLEVAQRFEDHTEFVLGLDFCNLVENRIATCSWDGTVRVWRLDPSLFE